VTQLGELALWIALLMAVWSVVVSVAGAVRRIPQLVTSADRALHAVLGLSVLSVAALVIALHAGDFSLRYVAAHTSTNLAGRYAVAALWAGPAGTTLLWTTLLAMGAAIVRSVPRAPGWLRHPFVTSILAALLVVLLASLTLGGGPFDRLAGPAPDGQGMRPRLQHPAMLLQPLVLYSGVVLAAVPFALAVTALLVRPRADAWFDVTRRWALASWVLISAGMLLELWWSYTEAGHPAGWVGAALTKGAILPWLVLGAWLYVGTERRQDRPPGAWTVILVVAAFPLAIFAALLASDALAQGREPTVRHVAAGVTLFVVLALVAAGTFVAWRLRHFADSTPRYRTHPGKRQYAWLLVYAAAVTIAAAVTGAAFERRYVLELSAGESAEVFDPYGRIWRFASEGISHYTGDDRLVTAVVLAVYRAGERAGLITSEERQHVDARGAPTSPPVAVPGIMSFLLQDVRVVLADAGDNDAGAKVEVAFVPLVWWLWLGGVLLITGAAIVAWPASVSSGARDRLSR
jgi:cytochrome c biogenesis factor